ncbi:Oxysterol-binding protein-like protein 1 [Golovinomyces cichoracearum]|uniref:Oxysterol-binding protein-like protein 1 n=1 Tax=Golovinomyces cichoracearum TaxID=62708 RepID=A0A420IEN4_9PEZI|nr:Oxysterol-binding protein-like protein 1 [Golovinomyces cichoracearum]
MSDSGETSHKRSLSTAISFLRRKEGKDDDDFSDEGSHTSKPETRHLSISVPNLGFRGYNHKLSSGTSSLMRPSSNLSNASFKITPQTAPTQEKAFNIEQTVKKFRLFEALRNGDTAYISKAIRESHKYHSKSYNIQSSDPPFYLENTTILHLAIQCAELPVIEYVISNSSGTIDINARDKDGNTPLHLAALQARTQAVRLLLKQPGINDSLANFQGKTPLDLARTPDIFQELQLARSLFVESKIRHVHELVSQGDYKTLSSVLQEPRVQTVLDINGGEFVSDPATLESGGTLLHEAARKKDTALIQVLFLHGADPFRRDQKGKLPQDVTRDDNTRAILKRSPAAVAAQRGIQEKAVLGSASHRNKNNISAIDAVTEKESREMKGYLKKWTNYRKGYQLRWFVLEDGVLSYYKYQEDAGSACRGAINMKIAKLHMDPTEKTRFDLLGKSSVKYNLKANHEVEAKRWFWALNNSIQWTKDQAREEVKQRQRSAELLRAAKVDNPSSNTTKELISEIGSENVNNTDPRRNSIQGNRLISLTTKKQKSLYGNGHLAGEDEIALTGCYEASYVGENGKPQNSGHKARLDNVDDDDDDDDNCDDTYSDCQTSSSKDAYDITAQSATLQLEVIGQINSALQFEQEKNPELPISDQSVLSVTQTFDSVIKNLQGLLCDLVKISKDRDAHWQYRIDREVDMRRMWEENMANFAQEQEMLEAKFGKAEEKRRLTKRALREVIENSSALENKSESNKEIGLAKSPTRSLLDKTEKINSNELKLNNESENKKRPSPRRFDTSKHSMRANTILADVGGLSESESDDEFFDAVDAGEVVVAPKLLPPSSSKLSEDDAEKHESVLNEGLDISPSFKGYEDGIRKRLRLDTDDRPKISLWGILKSMIGKDMTKMTLPVSFNEPTSLLQRCAEDLEYADLLDIACSREEATERMVYVAAFAASEYASTIGRVAKPFNPLLGETFEYVRPDKNYRFFMEQVSHHPPIGAAWVESSRWTYWGESAVKSKFYGKSFDINPLGTWFLKLKASNGAEELYTWKKVTTSVIGIITGSPTVENYGPMEIKNWNTGETCSMEFKSRGWKISSAYQLGGHVKDANGKTCYSIGGRWNNKIYARLTPGYEATVEEPKSNSDDSNKAFLVWEVNSRPADIPFNLTSFCVTLNDDNPKLLSWLPPTDSRLRPDQRAMEDGRYDEAAIEKNRVEEKQRAKRRLREEKGEEFIPQWFSKSKCLVTGEDYWKFNGKYWEEREKVVEGKAWVDCERIFEVD